MKKPIVVFLMFIGTFSTTIAQTDVPEWYRNKPTSLLSNVTLSTGSGNTEQEAFANALADAIGSSAGIQVPSQSLSDFNSGREIILPGINKKVKQMMVERSPSGRVYMLIGIQNNVTLPPDFDKQIFSTHYNFSGRAFIPGMAQLHKGSTTKGILFIAGHVACIGGIVATEGLRASYQSKINTTHNVKDKQNYINNADNMQNLRNGFIAGTALLYAWNVIDGIVAKGDLHLRLANNPNVKIMPHATFAGGGISLAINF